MIPYNDDGTVGQFLGLGSLVHPVDQFTVVGDPDSSLIDNLRKNVAGEFVTWKSAVESGIHQLFVSTPEPSPALALLERTSVADQAADLADVVTSGVVRDSQRSTWAQYGVSLASPAAFGGGRRN
jgi:hypothetical protein